MSQRLRNPLEPFATVVSALMAILVVLFVLSAVATAVSKDASMFGIGEQVICVDDPNISVGGGEAEARDLASTVKPGARALTNGLTGCLDHPTGRQHALRVAMLLPPAVFEFGTVLLLWLLVRGARREGPFASANSRRVRLVGWWLIAGGLASVNIVEAAKVALLRTMFRNAVVGWAPHVPWTLLLIGLGMLTVARLLAVAAVMRQDIEATI